MTSLRTFILYTILDTIILQCNYKLHLYYCIYEKRLTDTRRKYRRGGGEVLRVTCGVFINLLCLFSDGVAP